MNEYPKENHSKTGSVFNGSQNTSEFGASPEKGGPNFKVVLLGDAGVGKSSIIQRYTKGTFNDNARSTVGVDFENKKFRAKELKEIFQDSKEKNVALTIWDTAG